MLITADGGWRGGKVIELKEAADKALSQGCREHPQGHRAQAHRPGRDDVAGRATSGGTTSSKASRRCAIRCGSTPSIRCSCSTPPAPPASRRASSIRAPGYLLGAKLTSKWVFDLNEDDVFWCTADIGWVTGHSYVAYGPLAAGATIVIYEGAPTHPAPGTLLADLRIARASPSSTPRRPRSARS